MQKTSNILLLQFIEKLHKSNENSRKPLKNGRRLCKTVKSLV